MEAPCSTEAPVPVDQITARHVPGTHDVRSHSCWNLKSISNDMPFKEFLYKLNILL